MKFKLLSIGQKFEYKGETYIKTSPLIASNIETSHNKMIPRYAALKVLDNEGLNTRQVKKEYVGAKDTLDAFNLFYEQCIGILESHNVLIPDIKNKLDKARDDFTQKLI